jgi:CubicO group peptidase (beta-lactamase class C family)
MYGIGSVGKVFCAAAVMRLVDGGKVNLDAPLTYYIPEFTMADERYVLITPRMLLDHSSGINGSTFYNTFLAGDNSMDYHDNILRLLSEQTLKHDPGKTSIYCNDGFTLAEILVERVSGVSYTEFIDREFSKQLGLLNIKTPRSEFDREMLAPAYLGSNQMKYENCNAIGSGGVYSTMDDLVKYAQIFMKSSDYSLLSKASVDEMAKDSHQNRIVSKDADTVFNYGLGWDSVETYPFNQLGIKALSKGGATEKYHTNLTVLPEHNIAAAVSVSGAGGLEQLI